MKQSKRSANYHHPEPNGFRRCAFCSMFRLPDRCTAVEGSIKAGDVCDLWKLMPFGPEPK